MKIPYHHYIPQVAQKPFCKDDEEKLALVWDTVKGRQDVKSISRIYGEDGFNTHIENGEIKNTFEEQYHEAENSFGKYVQLMSEVAPLLVGEQFPATWLDPAFEMMLRGFIVNPRMRRANNAPSVESPHRKHYLAMEKLTISRLSLEWYLKPRFLIVNRSNEPFVLHDRWILQHDEKMFLPLTPNLLFGISHSSDEFFDHAVSVEDTTFSSVWTQAAHVQNSRYIAGIKKGPNEDSNLVMIMKKLSALQKQHAISVGDRHDAKYDEILIDVMNTLGRLNG